MREIKPEELLDRYLHGKATPEEVKLIEHWYASLQEGSPAALSPSERDRLKRLYWSRLQGRMHARTKQRALWKNIAAVAAVFVGLLVGLAYLLNSWSVQPQQPIVNNAPAPHHNTTVIRNKTDDIRLYRLADGSAVSLHPEGVLQIEQDFDIEDRKVTLTGQASFDVARNELKPFFVMTGEVTTRVLGTNFTVVAYPEAREITVKVLSGSVRVSSHADAQSDAEESSVMLKPNQQAVYNKDEKKVSRTLVKNPRLLISEQEVEKIRFEGAAVADIFNALEKMYGVEIVFDKKAFAACSMTTSISRGDLYEKIEVICEITGARYSIEDGRILIQGGDCQ